MILSLGGEDEKYSGESLNVCGDCEHAWRASWGLSLN